MSTDRQSDTSDLELLRSTLKAITDWERLEYEISRAKAFKRAVAIESRAEALLHSAVLETTSDRLREIFRKHHVAPEFEVESPDGSVVLIDAFFQIEHEQYRDACVGYVQRNCRYIAERIETELAAASRTVSVVGKLNVKPEGPSARAVAPAPIIPPEPPRGATRLTLDQIYNRRNWIIAMVGVAAGAFYFLWDHMKSPGQAQTSAPTINQAPTVNQAPVINLVQNFGQSISSAPAPEVQAPSGASVRAPVPVPSR